MNHKSGALRILIMEPHVEGHHGPSMQWMVEGLAERDFKITLMTLPESQQHPSLEEIFSTLPEGVDVVFPDNGNQLHRHAKGGGALKLIQRDFTYWRLFHNWYRQQAEKRLPDVILLPYLDYCLYAIGILGSPFEKTPWVGVTMRPSFHYRQMGIAAPRPSFERLKKLLFFRLLRSNYLKRLLTIDEPLIEYLNYQGAQTRNVQFLPESCDLDVLPDSREAKRKIGISSSRKVILIYGCLTSRKGIGELLLAIDHPKCPQNVDVLLAGMVADDIRTLLGNHWVQALQSEHRLIVIDHFITLEEERFLFSAADIVWLGYNGHYTASGVLVQAARAGRPVIACEDGVLGWQTRHHNLGVVVRPSDIGSVVNGIRMLTENEEMCVAHGINGRRAFGGHTVDRAKEALASAFGP